MYYAYVYFGNSKLIFEIRIIGGNHDLTLDSDWYKENGQCWHYSGLEVGYASSHPFSVLLFIRVGSGCRYGPRTLGTGRIVHVSRVQQHRDPGERKGLEGVWKPSKPALSSLFNHDELVNRASQSSGAGLSITTERPRHNVLTPIPTL